MTFAKFNRSFHRWASIIVALPILIVIVTGIVLQLKKDVAWVQPPTQAGSTTNLALPFDRVLEIAKTVPQAEIKSWDDVDRLDVRPSKGMLKVRANNRWEVQIDADNGEILQVAYRRSDWIESLHDGSFFHDTVKLWIFLPSAVMLFTLWLTGIYLFLLPSMVRRRRRKKTTLGAETGER